MNTPVVKFNSQDQPEFVRELRKRVNAYFEENKISKNANLNMVLKTVFMFCLYFVPLFLMISGTFQTFWPVFALWLIMGLGMAGIGLSVMHDANHSSYSKNPLVNKILGFSINFISGYHINWKIQHNVLHHTFTNIEGYDDDIGNKLMRFSPTVEHKPAYKYQVYYAPFLYAIMTLYWLLGKDFVQIARYHKKNLLEGQGLTLRKALLELVINKSWYILLTLVIPMMALDLPNGQIFIGFLCMHFLCGLILALIFQPAHVLLETDFYEVDEKGSVENNWAIHQLRTTSNFANDSKLFSWLIGGLNFQIEHHLFPNICHVHYKKLSPIIKKTAEEYNIPYHQHKTFLAAVVSHFSHLNQLGNDTYDKGKNFAHAA